MSNKNNQTQATGSGSPAENQQLNIPESPEALTGFISENFITGFSDPAPAEQAEPEVTQETEGEESEEVLSQSDNSEQVADEGGEQAEEEEKPAVEEAEPEILPTDPKGVQKRIGKLSKKAKEAIEAKEAAEAKVRELEAQLQQAQPKQSEQPAAPSQPISKFAESLNSIEDINKAHGEALEVILWAEANPDGGIVNGNEITAEQVRAIKLNAVRQKEVEIPQRYQWLVSHEQARKDASQEWEWFNKPETKEYQEMQQALRVYPALKQNPAYPMVVGYLIEGVKAVQSRKAANKVKSAVAAAAKPKAPAPPVTANAIPSKDQPKQNKGEAARANFYKAPSSDSALDYLKEAHI